LNAMDLSEKTVLITGASGFIGKNAREYFHDKCNVVAPLHRELDLLSQGEVQKFFRENEVDYVIHCANIGGNRKCGNIEGVVEKNLAMFFNIAENKQYFEKMIHLGSGAEYNRMRMAARTDEDRLGRSIPTDPYGFSKYVISKYIEEENDKLYCLRLFGVFGRYEDYEYKFISNAIVKNLLHLPITIRQNVHFDWLYVDDLLPIIGAMLNKKCKYKSYNITTGTTTDLITIAKIINKLSDFTSKIIVVNPGLNMEYSGENNRLQNEVEDFKFRSMQDSIMALRHYYKSIFPLIDADAIRKDEYAAYCKIIPGGT
jgi:nucleoside-diphosphate-sugar epimerase